MTGGAKVANYEYQRKCPNAQNLIAIIGDSSDPDRLCDVKCNLQIRGMGRRRGDVVISGQRSKLNVIRADRADGIHLRNFTVEFSDFNNIYILETNGFAMVRIQSRYSREYGFLSFTSDHGLYNRLEAFGSGDSGIYPGSGPEGHCQRYGIEIAKVNSHHNTIGYSGTAGNGVYAHDSRFHHNATGMTTASFASGHPGMPQDCAKCPGAGGDGDAVAATPVFLDTFGKSLWSPGRGPEQMPETELLRTGRIAFLRPGEEVPFAVAWHAVDGEPAVVDYGEGSVRVPG